MFSVFNPTFDHIIYPDFQINPVTFHHQSIWPHLERCVAAAGRASWSVASPSVCPPAAAAAPASCATPTPPDDDDDAAAAGTRPRSQSPLLTGSSETL